MSFPTASSVVYRNEDGEPIGWDTPSYDDPPEYEDFYDNYDEEEDEEDYDLSGSYDDAVGPDEMMEDQWLDGSYEE